jgi:hypothetical protein
MAADDGINITATIERLLDAGEHDAGVIAAKICRANPQVPLNLARRIEDAAKHELSRRGLRPRFRR